MKSVSATCALASISAHTSTELLPIMSLTYLTDIIGFSKAVAVCARAKPSMSHTSPLKSPEVTKVSPVLHRQMRECDLRTSKNGMPEDVGVASKIVPYWAKGFTSRSSKEVHTTMSPTWRLSLGFAPEVPTFRIASMSFPLMDRYLARETAAWTLPTLVMSLSK